VSAEKIPSFVTVLFCYNLFHAYCVPCFQISKESDLCNMCSETPLYLVSLNSKLSFQVLKFGGRLISVVQYAVKL